MEKGIFYLKKNQMKNQKQNRTFNEMAAHSILFQRKEKTNQMKKKLCVINGIKKPLN